MAAVGLVARNNCFTRKQNPCYPSFWSPDIHFPRGRSDEGPMSKAAFVQPKRRVEGEAEFSHLNRL
jgi:hypothetical protein